jgi:predicted permease
MNLFVELRLALRRLSKQPGFMVTTIVTLALAIGANTAIFSVVYAVLMHPSGVDAPERLAVMHTHYAQLGLDFPVVSVPDYADAASLKAQVESAALENGVAYNAVHDGTIEHLDGAQVSWQWFNVFGAKPILGRTFTPEEDHPNANQVAVLSFGMWQSVFGGARDVIGRTLMLDQTPYRVVGVMRSDFDWPRGTAIWTPMGLPPQAFTDDNRFNESYNATIRLRPHVTFAELSAGLASKVREENFREGGNGFGQKSGWEFAAVPLTEFAAGSLRQPLYVLLGVVVLVLLIASANVAGLFLARTSTRNREFAIRTALGASAGSLVRQLLTETLLLAGVATAIGIVLGPVFGRALLWMVPHSLARGYTVNTSLGVLIFTAGMGLLTSLICGVGPAVKMIRSQEHLDLHEGGRSVTASHEKQRLHSLFVIGEVALAFVLLTGTGMFLASLRELQQVNPGFNPHGVLAGTVYYAGATYRDNQQRQEAFVTTALNNLAQQPGVKAAAATSSLPFSNQAGAGSFHIEGRPETANDSGPHSQIATATADYLKVMQMPLLAGRWIGSEDRVHTEPVVVIDEKLAHKYWPAESPIGQKLKFSSKDPWSTIVGVVGNVRSSSLEEDSGDGMRYYPYAQYPNMVASFVVRTEGNPYLFAQILERAITTADSTQTAFDINALESRVNASLASRRLIVWLLTAFSGLALLLALIGIYGLISYVTVQRMNEFGIRMALGARRGQVIALVMKGALLWVGIGLAIGVTMSSLVTSTLKHSFAAFGVDVIPSLLFALVAMLTVGVAAGSLPAQRAASTDPAKTLRNE